MQCKNMPISQDGVTVVLGAPAAVPRHGSQRCKCKFRERAITMVREWNTSLCVALLSCFAMALTTFSSDANTTERISSWSFFVGGSKSVEDGMTYSRKGGMSILTKGDLSRRIVEIRKGTACQSFWRQLYRLRACVCSR